MWGWRRRTWVQKMDERTLRWVVTTLFLGLPSVVVIVRTHGRRGKWKWFNRGVCSEDLTHNPFVCVGLPRAAALTRGCTAKKKSRYLAQGCTLAVRQKKCQFTV